MKNLRSLRPWYTNFTIAFDEIVIMGCQGPFEDRVKGLGLIFWITGLRVWGRRRTWGMKYRVQGLEFCPIEPHVNRSWNCRAFPQDPQTLKPSGFLTLKPSNLQPQNPQIKSSGLETRKPSNPEVWRGCIYCCPRRTAVDSARLSLWEGFRESRRCSRDTYPASYITEHILIYEDRQSLDGGPRESPSSTASPRAERYRGTSLIRPPPPRRTLQQALA